MHLRYICLFSKLPVSNNASPKLCVRSSEVEQLKISQNGPTNEKDCS